MRKTAPKHDSSWPGISGGFIAFLLFVSPRIICLPLLLLALVVTRRRPRARFMKFCAWSIVFLAYCSPVDLAVPSIGYPGLLWGHPRSGVRFVPVIVGMPAHTALAKRYAEYYCAGCSGWWLFQPLWVLTWE
jgi:hypothetical protein